MTQSHTRRLCGTIWPDKLPDDFRMPESLPAGARILAYQPEICPDTGRAHWQFYIALLQSSKAATFMTALGLTKKKQWHAEECKGDEADNLKYCSKSDSRCVSP